MASADLREELNCSICLGIYTDPVTLVCGHSFCWECITLVLDTQEKSGAYSCPECRAELHGRPSLQTNITLCNIAERFPSAQQRETGIFCRYCINSLVPAVKSCLMCEASLCEHHLKVHSKSVEHILCDPTTSLGNRKCPVHEEALKYYCTTDSVCICMSCLLAGEHRGHLVDLPDEASKNKKEKLQHILRAMTTKKDETEHRACSLQEHRKEVRSNTADLMTRVSVLFIDIKRRLEELEKKVLSDIFREEEEVLLSVSELIQKLEKEKDQLSKEMRHIEELCKASDPITILEDNVITISDFCDGGPANTDNDGDKRKLNLDPILENLRTSLTDIVTYENRGISLREELSIILDANTASSNVTLSDDLKVVSTSKTTLNLPKTPERFENNQVLSTVGFTSGKHYWDVETDNTGSWTVGMAYTSIDRRGEASFLGFNEKSWGLRFCDNQYSVRHNRNVIAISCSKSCNKFRIVFNYETGQLSFYKLGDEIIHLHTFTTTFTEPLHAVFRVWGESYIRVLS